MATIRNNELWEISSILRKKMTASESRNYFLGLIFYKYLSDLELREIYAQETDLMTAFSSQEEEFGILDKWSEEAKNKLEEMMRLKHGYFIKPKHLFYWICQRAKYYDFKLSELQEAFRDLEKHNLQFQGIFSDIVLDSTKLGSDEFQRKATIIEVIQALEGIDSLEVKGEGESIGDTYEYLIECFATKAGKKVSEFYTPQSISRLISEIAAFGQENKAPFHIYDPTMGSASMMLKIRNYIHDKEQIHYQGQELNTATYNLARMNLILHGVKTERIDLKNADTLGDNGPTEVSYQSDAVVMNPPYSAKWSADGKFLIDARFADYKKLAPKSKADFAFLLHGFYHLKDTGTMGIILPHGVLFRGAAERTIRKKLLEMGAIDAVIGLPANILYTTSIPTAIIILKKNRVTCDNPDVLFIDASNAFEKQKNQNILRDSDIDKIIATYKKRENVEKYAHLASFKEIESNDFNLNISRYVHTFEEENPIDIVDLSKEISQLNQEINQTEQELYAMLEELATDSDSNELIEAAKRVLGE